MTTIIGLEYDDSCVIVADSRTTDDNGRVYSHPNVKKISEVGPFLVAGSGETLPCDIAQNIWEPPTPTKSDYKDLYKFMIVKAMPSLRKCLIDNGYNFEEDTKETRFTFIIAIGGELFDVDQWLSVMKSDNGVYVAGSGGAYALGALFHGADAYEAMDIAARISVYTAPPYISKTQFKHIK